MLNGFLKAKNGIRKIETINGIDILDTCTEFLNGLLKYHDENIEILDNYLIEEVLEEIAFDSYGGLYTFKFNLYGTNSDNVKVQLEAYPTIPDDENHLTDITLTYVYIY